MTANTYFNYSIFVFKGITFIKPDDEMKDNIALNNKSLFILTHKNIIRKTWTKIVTWKHFDTIIIILIIINSILLGIIDYENPDSDSWRNRIVHRCEPFFTAAFTLEALLKIISIGFVMHKGSYLRDAWNWLDFVVVVTSLLSILPGVGNVSGIRTFRLFRPLRSFTSMPSMKTLIATILSSLVQLGEILILFGIVFFIFSILGVSLWAGDIHYRCRVTPEPVNGTWPVVDGDTRLWGGHRSCPIGYCGSIIEQYDSHPETINKSKLTCSISEMYDHNLYWDTRIEELHYGRINFDNIGNALLTVFQCLTLEGWADIMNNFQDSYDKYFTTIYFIALVLVWALLLINLIIAVLLDKLEENQNKNHSDDNYDELVQHLVKLGFSSSQSLKYNKSEDPLKEMGWAEFLISHELNMVKSNDKEGTSKLYKIVQESLLYFLKKPKIMYPEDKYFEYKIVKWIYYLVNHPLFHLFIFLSIITNTITLWFDYYELDKEQDRPLAFEIMNYAFMGIFTTEVILKIIGLGWKLFVKDKFNLFDTLVVIFSILEILIADGSGATSSLRAFRLFRIFKIFRVGNLRIMLDCLAKTITSIGNYIILLLLFMYVFALMGMQFFAGKLKFDKENQPDSHGK